MHSGSCIHLLEIKVYDNYCSISLFNYYSIFYIAREFYVIDIQVIDTFIDIINKEDPEHEIILDNIDDECIDQYDYIPEILIKSIYGQQINILLSQDTYEDSLTDLQKQYIKKYYKKMI